MLINFNYKNQVFLKIITEMLVMYFQQERQSDCPAYCQGEAPAELGTWSNSSSEGTSGFEGIVFERPRQP